MARECEGFTAECAEEDGERMAMVDEFLPEYRRLVFRKKGFLGGWRELSMCVGDLFHHLGTVKLICTMLREDGDDPADYEFRIDRTPPVKWEPGEILDGATVADAKGIKA